MFNVKKRLQNKKSSLYTQLYKRKEEIRHIQRDVQDYNDSIDKEEAERLASGAGRRGRAKKHKPVPEWSPDAEMLAIVNKTIYHKHKYMKYLFLDTNIFLHYSSFETIPWKEIVGDDFTIVVVPIVQAAFEIVDEFHSSERGSGGFGSTGQA